MTNALPSRLAILLLLGCAGVSVQAASCTSAASAEINFGAFAALASSGDQSSNSGSSFWVNCTADVPSPPALYSATPRTLLSGGNSLPFGLSTVTPGGTELPSASPGTALSIVRDGTNQTVTLHARIRNQDFRALPSGLYARMIALTVEY